MQLQATMILSKGRHVSWWGAVKTWLPFCIIMALGLAFGTWKFALAWTCGLFLPLLLWFIFQTYALKRKQTPPSSTCGVSDAGC